MLWLPIWSVLKYASRRLKNLKHYPVLHALPVCRIRCLVFFMTQARDKLARTPVKDQQQAIRTHEVVGKEVREAIKRIGGVMPENIPPAEHISEVEKRIKNTPPTASNPPRLLQTAPALPPGRPRFPVQ